jgi:hypothetical protein
MSIKHTRHKIITVKTSPSKLLNVLQNEPLEYLRISGVAVEETLQAFKAGDTTGEWMGESFSVPAPACGTSVELTMSLSLDRNA